MQSIHLYFLGRAQGLYLQTETLPKLISKARAAIADCADDYREDIESGLAHIRAESRKGYSSVGCEYGARGIEWRNRPVDPWELQLNRDCAGFGQFPGLAYAMGAQS